MTVEELAKRRDRLRSKLVKDRQAEQELRHRIANRARKLKTVLKRLRKARRHGGAKGISSQGLEMIAYFEGEVDHCYDDSAGHASIGIGHLLSMASCAASGNAGKTITHQQAVNLLHADALVAINAVRSDVTVKLNQPQFDALVSFTFNCGSGALASSSLLTAVNAKAAPSEIARCFELWHIGGAGLLARRQAEATCFNTGKYPS